MVYPLLPISILGSLSRRCLSSMANPKVFFDISADATPLGRVVMELRADVCTVVTFRTRLYI